MIRRADANEKRQAVASKKARISESELLSMIQKRAYELFLKRGGAHGNDQSDWYRAEQELGRTARM